MSEATLYLLDSGYLADLVESGGRLLSWRETQQVSSAWTGQKKRQQVMSPSTGEREKRSYEPLDRPERDSRLRALRPARERQQVARPRDARCVRIPLRSEYGRLKTVKAIFWPGLSGKTPETAFSCALFYRGTSLIKNRRLLGPYSRAMPRALWKSWGGGRFLMSEVPL